MQEGGRAALDKLRTSRAWFLLAIGITLAIDRTSKLWALDELAGGRRIPILGKFLGLRLVFNPGGVFGLLPGSTIIIFFASFVVVVGAIAWGWRHPEIHGRLGIVVGGGIGNLVDRVIYPPGMFRGEVVDFIDSSFWPTFNLADSAIVVGVGLLLLFGLRDKERLLDRDSESR